MIESMHVQHDGKTWSVDLKKPIDISIPIKDGEENPNCYWSESPEFNIIRSGSFVGSVKEGGPVNHRIVTITPHGNGTHTECYGHISAEGKATLNNCLKNFHFMALLVSVTPENKANGDKVITVNQLKKVLSEPPPEAVIIRTIPNGSFKRTKKYSGTNPPYIEADLAEFLARNGVKHLLIDLPSVDREEDEGRLSAHKAFWETATQPRKDCTITELIFVPENVVDGVYLLNLQTTSLDLDASPSKPILFPVTFI